MPLARGRGWFARLRTRRQCAGAVDCGRAAMFRAYLRCHPWDFDGVAIDEALSFVQGTLGATGLELIAGSGPQVRLRCRRGSRSDVVRTRGGLFFAPDEARYHATRCKPLAAERARDRGRLAQVADAARARGLGLRLAVSTMRLGRVAGKWPAAAVRNVLDDVSPERLCPTNPDVVEMVAALVADIADTYAPDAIVLYDFDRGHTGEATAGMENVTDIGPAGDAIMSLCACESCRQGAAGDGVDTDAAIRSARVTLDRALEGCVPGSRTFAGLLSEDAVLRAYVNWQSESLTGALARARERCVTKLVLHRRGGETSGTTDIGRLSRYADGVAVRCLQSGGGFKSLLVEDKKNAYAVASSWLGSGVGIQMGARFGF